MADRRRVGRCNVAEVRVIGQSVEFDARTTGVDPNRGIGWNGIGGDVETPGEARFEEAAPGRTRVDVTVNHAPAPASLAARSGGRRRRVL